jgi:hypothetical protein
MPEKKSLGERPGHSSNGNVHARDPRSQLQGVILVMLRDALAYEEQKASQIRKDQPDEPKA